MKLIHITAIIFVALLSSAITHSAEPLIQEHKAYYTAKIDHGLSLSGTATRELRKAKDGAWSYTFFVDTLPATIHEQSTFAMTNAQIEPLMYSYALEGALIKNRYQAVKFSSEATQKKHTINETYKDKSWTYIGDYGVLDRLNYQLQLQVDVSLNNTEPNDNTLNYHVAHKGKLRSYAFKTKGQQTIQTTLGEKSALVVEKVRQDTARETTLWFDTEAPYALLRFIQTEGDGERYEINITRIELLN